MQIAIDNTCLQNIDKIKKYDLLYVFDNEPLEDLLKLKLHCIHISQIQDVDINLSKYKINALKTAKIEEIDKIEIPKKKNYKFAIIVPSYNNDHGKPKEKTFLKKCVESILKQTYKNFELIVVDDMSTDTSVETVDKYVEKDKRVHQIKNRRKRYNGGSRNVGIEYALDNIDFDYFAFLDSDDWFKDKYVLENINNNLWNCELMLTGTEILYEDGTVTQKINDFDTFEDLFLSTDKCWCTAWCRVIRKDKIVYFPERNFNGR